MRPFTNTLIGVNIKPNFIYRHWYQTYEDLDLELPTPLECKVIP